MRLPLAFPTLLGANEKAERILTITAKHVGVSVNEIKSRNRTKLIAFARHLAVYLMRKHTKLTWQTIGWHVGRHHATAIYSYCEAERYLKEQPESVARLLFWIEEDLRAPAIKADAASADEG